MARMDPWTHPTLTRSLDAYLLDGLESMGQGVFRAGMEPGMIFEPEEKLGFAGTITSAIGMGLDFLAKKKELDVQEDALKVQLQAAQKAKEVAQLQLAAAQAQRETAALQASADKKAGEARGLAFGLDVQQLILPIAIAGGVALLFFMRRRR